MPAFFDANRLAFLIDLLSPERPTRVVEVGANPINANPYGPLRDAGLCDVWGFEPNKTAFARLSNTERETYLPYAVGNGSVERFHMTRNSVMSSVLRPCQETLHFLRQLGRICTVEEVIEVETHALDEMEELPPFDLLKIDIQGGEVRVYEGAQKCLCEAVMIIAEVAFLPLYHDQPLFDAQMAALRPLGYDMHKFLGLGGISLRGSGAIGLENNRNRNQILDTDAVFLRSLRRPKVISNEQLKQMALLSDGVIESFDVTVRCLDLLKERGVLREAYIQDYIARLPERFQAKA